MNLDDLSDFPRIDTSGLLFEIQSMPNQLATAWEMAKYLPIPELITPKIIVLSGMGGLAASSDLLATYVKHTCTVPMFDLQDYEIPEWAKGKDTLFIAFSHKGNITETISLIEHATTNKCSIILISSEDTISKVAYERQIPIWHFDHQGEPNSAIGYSFAYSLALCERINVIPPQSLFLSSAVTAVEHMKERIDIHVPVKNNSAKRLAGQMMNRWISIIGSSYLTPVAKRWKNQINIMAKAWAQHDALTPNTNKLIARNENTQDILLKTMVIFLKSAFDDILDEEQVVSIRNELIRAGINTDAIVFKESHPLSERWTSILFGDYLAYYLAIAYQTDPNFNVT